MNPETPLASGARTRRLVSIILSFRNEALTISEMIARLTKVLSGQPEDYEIIYINDASSDNSLEILLREREKNPRIKVLNMARKFGCLECIYAGFRAARGDAVILMDSDLQDPPEVIPRLLEEWRNGADVVHTVRTRRLGENPIKMWLTGLGYRAIHMGSTIDLPIDSGDFKILSRRAIDHILHCREVDPYLRGLTVWVGFRQAKILYERAPRFAGTSHFPVLRNRNPWKHLVIGLTSFSFLPVYVCAIIAMIGAAASLATLVASAIMAASGTSGAGLCALIGLGVLLWSIGLGAVAIIGIYVVRIYKDVRGRPAYIIESTYGFDDESTIR